MVTTAASLAPALQPPPPLPPPSPFYSDTSQQAAVPANDSSGSEDICEREDTEEDTTEEGIWDEGDRHGGEGDESHDKDEYSEWEGCLN